MSLVQGLVKLVFKGERLSERSIALETTWRSRIRAFTSIVANAHVRPSRARLRFVGTQL
jgi:hypothetical protein